MRHLYTTLLYLAAPWVLLRLLWRSRKNPAYRSRLQERFGYIQLITNEKSIWVHAVSLGELIAAAPLINNLIQVYPKHTIVVTTTAPTGSKAAQQYFGNKIYHVYAPLDLPFALSRFLQRAHPEKAIIMETELWPNLLWALHRAQIPIFIANARMSQRSFHRYRRMARFFKPFLQTIHLVAAQSMVDGNRFLQLGATRMVVTGNMKFDVEIAPEIITAAKNLKSHWNNRPTWIAASTHEGEEQIILNAFTIIRQQIPNALLILVPRHPERFHKVAKLCREKGFTLAQRSLQQLPKDDISIYLGDTMGELKLLYATSDVAFVGGSLVPFGGHNLIEPASLSLPIISGVHLENSITVRNLLQEVEGLILVEHVDDLSFHVLQLLTNSHKRNLLGARALSVLDQNRGAIQKHLQYITAHGT